MTPIPTFEFSGGALCLDFVNTLGDRPRGESEKLHGPADLERWAREAGLTREPGSAGVTPRLLRRAIDLRERLYRVFSGISSGRPPDPEDLGTLNREVAAAMGRLRLDPSDGGVVWTWARDGVGAERLLWPIVRSAAELLTSDEAGRVKVCASETCSWLFVDRSPARRRRWCDMKSCGNRAKARRHYRRQRAARLER